MRRVFHSVLALALAAPMAAAVSAQQPTFNTNRQVTFVMRGGERHSGTLVYHNTADFSLIENGSERNYPASDIALVDFGTGDPNAAELNQLPQGNPPELRSHMLVRRDGSVVHGKVYTIKTDAITIDNARGNRMDVSLNDVSHLYMNPQAARSVFASTLNAPAPAPAPPAPSVGTAGNVPPGAIRVDATQAWTDTGITVKRGQQVAFSATGQVSIRQGAPADIGPDGSATDSRAGAPTPNTGVGGLIGRIGTGAPFAIGSHTQRISMPGAGRLFLGVNDAGTGDNSGAFFVTIVR